MRGRPPKGGQRVELRFDYGVLQRLDAYVRETNEQNKKSGLRSVTRTDIIEEAVLCYLLAREKKEK